MVENRKGCVQRTRKCEPQNLAQVVHCVTRHGRLQLAELTSLVRMQGAAFTRKTDGFSEDLPLGVAIAVCELQRDQRIAEEFCRRVGGVFVPLDARDATDADVHAALLKAVSEIGEDSSLISRVLADGSISVVEADAVDAEVDETIQALLQVKARVRAKVRVPAMAVRGIA